MVYKVALIHAAENGHQATVRTFNEKYGKKFRESFHEAGMLNGLTHEQAQVYAHSMGGSRSERQAAIQGLAATYAKRDAQGNMMRDDNGAPVLTKQNQKVVDYIVDTLTASTQAGSKAGSYMIGIAQYNLETGRREQSSSIVDTPLKHASSGKSTFRKM